MLRRMDAAQALADLSEISSQVVQAAILDTDGSVLASTIDDQSRTERFVAGVERLLDEAGRLCQGRGLPSLNQLEVATLDGSVFVVRRGGRLVAATTRSDPTVGLVFYDLKHCLGSIEGAAAEQAAEAGPPENGTASPPTRPRGKKADASA